ncbi:MAG: GNAT family N-acetyltransferase [Planctomycetota bacterium]
MMLFRTPRLIVRRLGVADLDALVAVYGGPEGLEFVGDGEPLPRSECERWIEVTARNYATRGYGMAAIVEAAKGSVIGFVGIVHPSGQPEPEIKYALLARARGRGFATEAVDGMLAYAAFALGYGRVIATIHPSNLASQRVMLKCGAQRLATLRDADGGHTELFVWRAEHP